VTVEELLPAGLAARLPTAPLAAAGLIAGFGVAVASGSRPLGGAVMAACGLTCIAVWLQRDGRRVAAELTGVGLVAFAASHLLADPIGAWPSVLAVSAGTAAACWWRSDSRRVRGLVAD
jgi:tetrahydromethanopterin S-methyltransferase subunit C